MISGQVPKRPGLGAQEKTDPTTTRPARTFTGACTGSFGIFGSAKMLKNIEGGGLNTAFLSSGSPAML